MRFVLLVLVASLAGCGGPPPPTRQLGRSQAAVRAAEELDARETPQAALHLKMARDHLARAERLMADEAHEDAELVLRRAEADAELAVALAREADERARAEDAMRKVQLLRRELD